MENKMPRFVDLAIGTKFTFEGNEYVKIKDERINCCNVNNAALTSDANQKRMIVPVTDVEVVEE